MKEFLDGFFGVFALFGTESLGALCAFFVIIALIYLFIGISAYFISRF